MSPFPTPNLRLGQSEWPRLSFCLSALPGEFKDVPKPYGIYDPPRPESPHSWTCLENLHKEASRRLPNQMPKVPQLTPFNVKEQQFYSNSFGMSELLTLSPQVSPATLQRKLNSKLMAICEGWNID